MTQTEQQPKLTVTRDELLALLQIMGASTMNGLPNEPLAGLAERERAERLNSGLQTLLNRNLAEARDANQLVLDDTLVALVGSCVIPAATLLLSALQPDGANEPHYFNAAPQILVEHELPSAGIHTFRYLSDGSALQSRVQSFLAGLQPISVATEFSITLSDERLTVVLQAARANQPAQAVNTLMAEKWPEAEARAFVEAAAGFPIYTAICATGLRDETAPTGQTRMAICSLVRCWLIRPTSQGENIFNVQAISGKDCIRAFVALCEPLAHVASAAR